MDGLLLVDKPSGPTSHDVVFRVRKALREKRIGHTGTLDPMASGVLPLVVGRATRLARFLPGTKAYDAVIRLGQNTDTCDAQGESIGPAFDGPWPAADGVDAALDAFRGTFQQQPPAFSAKKIGGRRSYDLARRARDAGADLSEASASLVLPEPVIVTASSVTLLGVDSSEVRVRVRCSAGFYIRSLAFDLGVTLGTGAHLTALRRTEAAGFGLDRAVPLDRLQTAEGADVAAAALIPLGQMLGDLPSVRLSPEGVAHVKFGRNLGPADAVDGFAAAVAASAGPDPRPIRLFDQAGELVAMAQGAPHARGLLHAAVVLM